MNGVVEKFTTIRTYHAFKIPWCLGRRLHSIVFEQNLRRLKKYCAQICWKLLSNVHASFLVVAVPSWVCLLLWYWEDKGISSCRKSLLTSLLISKINFTIDYLRYMLIESQSYATSLFASPSLQPIGVTTDSRAARDSWKIDRKHQKRYLS